MRSRSLLVGALTTFLAACAGDPATPTDPICTISSVAVAGAPVELEVGEHANLTPSFSASNCTGLPTATWRSSDIDVAWVDGNGLFWATGVGSVTITVTAGGLSGEATVLVAPPTVASLVLDGEKVTVGQGFDSRVSATIYRRSGALHEDQSLLAWQSRDTSVATVSATGAIRAVAAGRTWAVAQAAARKDSIEIVVSAPAIYYGRVWDATVPGIQPADREWQYNPTGPDAYNTFSRMAAGHYRVHWTGLEMAPGTTTTRLMTPTFEDAGTICWVPQWTHETMEVRCVDANGTSVDSRISAATVGAGTYGGDSFFALVVPSPSGVTIDPAWSHHAGSRPMTVTRGSTAQGTFTISVPRISSGGPFQGRGIAVVVGNTAASCHASGPIQSATTILVNVRCVDLTGTPVDVPFQATFMEGTRAGGALAAYNIGTSGTPLVVAARAQPIEMNTTLVSLPYFEPLRIPQGNLQGAIFLQSALGGLVGDYPNQCRFIRPYDSSIIELFVQCSRFDGIYLSLPFNFVVLQ